MSIRHSWHQFTRTGERVRQTKYLYKNENRMETVFFTNSRSVLEEGKGLLDVSCVATCNCSLGKHVNMFYFPPDLCLAKDLTCVASCTLSHSLHSFSQIWACLTASHNVEKSCCNVWHFVVFFFFFNWLTIVTIVLSRLHVCTHVCGKLCAWVQF